MDGLRLKGSKAGPTYLSLLSVTQAKTTTGIIVDYVFPLQIQLNESDTLVTFVNSSSE